MDWPLLAGIDEHERRQILGVARRRTFRRDEVVVHRGDPADTMHLISKGRFAVQVVTPLGQTAVLALLTVGQTFGELALVSSDARRSATVLALEPAATLSIHHEDFRRLRAAHPGTADVLIAVLSEQVRRLSRQVVEALYVDAERRVLRRLLDAAEAYPAEPDGLEVPLTQEILAGLAGTSRASVNRVLRDAEKRGIVELRRGRVRILDMEALAHRGGRRDS